MDFTNYLANKLISATVRAEPFILLDKAYLALYTEDPTKAGFTSNEVSEPSYNRQEITFAEPVDGVSANSSQIDFSGATSNWGTIGWVGIMDASYGGYMLYFSGLDEPKTILSGDQFKIDATKLNLTLT